jgi:hypothetical protein
MWKEAVMAYSQVLCDFPRRDCGKSRKMSVSTSVPRTQIQTRDLWMWSICAKLWRQRCSSFRSMIPIYFNSCIQRSLIYDPSLMCTQDTLLHCLGRGAGRQAPNWALTLNGLHPTNLPGRGQGIFLSDGGLMKWRVMACRSTNKSIEI